MSEMEHELAESELVDAMLTAEANGDDSDMSPMERVAARLTDELSKAQAKIAEARVLLIELTEAEWNYPCQFDHHGNCQAHDSFGEPGDCVIPRVRKWLGVGDCRRSEGER
jgi:hypothetical protein